jgi:hypothetical protein
MALNFPSTPSDGDTFEGYVYRSATGTWDYNELTSVPTIDCGSA